MAQQNPNLSVKFRRANCFAYDEGVCAKFSALVQPVDDHTPGVMTLTDIERHCLSLFVGLKQPITKALIWLLVGSAMDRTRPGRLRLTKDARTGKFFCWRGDTWVEANREHLFYTMSEAYNDLTQYALERLAGIDEDVCQTLTRINRIVHENRTIKANFLECFPANVDEFVSQVYPSNYAFPEFNAEKCRVRVLNGLVDLTSGRFLPHTPTHFDARTLPHTLDLPHGGSIGDLDSSDAETFLREVFINNDDDALNEREIEFVLYTIAKFFIGSENTRVILWFTGLPSTSKSTFLKIIEKALGDDFFHAANDAFFSKKQGGITDVEGLRAASKCIFNVAEGAAAHAGESGWAKMKAYSGGDSTCARFLNSNDIVKISFRGTIVLTSNGLEPAYAAFKDEGLRDRLCPIIFQKRFLSPDVYRKNLKKYTAGANRRRFGERCRDEDELTTRVARSFVNLLLKRAHVYCETGMRVDVPSTIRDSLSNIEERVDPAVVFFKRHIRGVAHDECARLHNVGETLGNLFELYNLVCEDLGDESLASELVSNDRAASRNSFAEKRSHFKAMLEKYVGGNMQDFAGFKYSTHTRPIYDNIIDPSSPNLLNQKGGYVGIRFAYEGLATASDTLATKLEERFPRLRAALDAYTAANDPAAPAPFDVWCATHPAALANTPPAARARAKRKPEPSAGATPPTEDEGAASPASASSPHKRSKPELAR